MKETNGVKRVNRNQTDVDVIMDSLSDKEKIAYLRNILDEDYSWRKAFIRRYVELDIEDLKEEFAHGFENIIYENSYYGFINYRNSFKCESELEEFLDDFIKPLIEKEAYEEAFYITAKFATLLVGVDIDDSNGFFESMMITCTDYWKKFLAKRDKSLTELMYLWFRDFVTKDVKTYEDKYDNLWFIQEETEKFFLDSLKIYKKNVSFYKDLADEIAAYHIDACYAGSDHFGTKNRLTSEAISWVLVQVKCMRLQGFLDKEIETYVLSLPPHLRLIQPLIDKAIKKKNISKAKELLIQYLERKGSDCCPIDAIVQLCNLYKQKGNTNEQVRLLKRLIVDGRTYKTEQIKGWIKDLQETCGKDWKKVEKDLCAKLASDSNKDRLRIFYEATERYDDLLNALEAVWDYYQYWDVLAHRYPEKYIDTIGTRVKDNLMGPAQKRQDYVSQVDQMKRLQTLPGGEKFVADLAQELRETYPRRRALMDELGKL